MDNNVSANDSTHVLRVNNSDNAQPMQTAVGSEPYLPTNDIGNATAFGLCQISDRRLEDRTFAPPQAPTTSTFRDHNTPPLYSQREDINIADADSDESSFTVKERFLNHPQTMRLLKDNQECIVGYLSDDTMGSIFREQLANNSQPADTTTIILNTLENSPEEDAISDFIGKIREMKNGKHLARQLQSLYEGICNNEEIPAPGAGYEQAIRNKNSFIRDVEVKKLLYLMARKNKDLLRNAIHALPFSVASSGDKRLCYLSISYESLSSYECLTVILKTSFRGDAGDQLIKQLDAQIKTTKDEELNKHFKVLQTRYSKISATDDSSNRFSKVRSLDQAASSLTAESIIVLNRQ